MKVWLLKKICLFVAICFFVFSPTSGVTFAIDEEFYSGNDILFYDPSAKDVCSTDASIATSNGTLGMYTIDQVKTFASEPITSTWNISDSTAEQWFLKQAGARATITKYGLTSSNISEITSAVKAAGVSPVFFYAYTVNEGGGAGGFINHYIGDITGGGIANAKHDAEYLATQSKIMDSKPSWTDTGTNDLDFVPKDIQAAGNADFQKMPSGTIGRAYIPATAATTWEVYYPNGLKKEYNQIQNYGTPLNDTMRNIKKMGGNPMEGGASISSGSCINSVVGEGMTKGINWAKMIAANDGYGYDQPGRATGWEKWKSDPNCASQCGNFDCSSFISAIITVAGYTPTNLNFATPSMPDDLKKAGFTQVASSAKTSKDLLPGDILLTDGHTEMYVGNNQNVGAHINENGEASGGKVGDQSGKEISIGPFYDDNWTSVWRALK